MRQRTQVINALRAHMAELGIVAAQGREGTKALLAIIAGDGDERLPVDARASQIVLAAQLQALQTLIGSIEKRIIAQHRASEASKRLATVPGIGILGASAITTMVTDPKAFRSGRDFAAWVGLVPRQDSTAANTSLGRSPNRAIATCVASWLLVRMRSCGVPANIPKNIRGSHGSWRDVRSRSSRLRWPIKWRASLGPCWPRVGAIGCLGSRQREKGPANGRMRFTSVRS